jgi:hypothetical protein
MVYQWKPEAELDVTSADIQKNPHPALEPISAWFFRHGSPFLVQGGLTDAVSLYSMVIDGGGFDASAPDAFKAREMSSLGPKTALGHLFSPAFLDPLLEQIEASIVDPTVFVLPVPTDGILSDIVLQSRQELGDPPADRPPLDARPPPKAIIGIIDHGINIFHHRFRFGATGSRVAFAWDQGAARDDHLPFGAEWHRGTIEAAQVAAGGDEDALLRQIGADFERPGFRPLAQRASHGTHVLDLAAGMDPQDPEGARFPIIAVTLPPEVTRDTSGSMLALPFVLGLEYILDRARALSEGLEDVPQVFVNFSFGLSGGPRMGRHQLERTVQNLAARHMGISGAERPPVVAVAAGNRNLSRGHAQNAPCETGLSVIWHTQPADPTSNFLEIRVVASAGQVTALQLSVTPPGQSEALTVTLDVPPDDPVQGPQLLALNNGFIGRASLRALSDGVTLLTLALAPSDPGPAGGPVAPAGDWLVSVETPGATPDRIDAYIMRDDVPHGFRDIGRQSYFVDPAYADRDESGRLLIEDPDPPQSVIRRSGTLNAIATAGTACEADRHHWVVGAYVGPDTSGELHAADYSAAPLSETDERIDCSAQGDQSKVLSGVPAAGTRSGTLVRINGTSIAAPQLIRHLSMGKGNLNEHPTGAPATRIGAALLLAEK